MPWHGGSPIMVAPRVKPLRLITVSLLGSRAEYMRLWERDGIITALVLKAPGLRRGARIRLLASKVDR